MSLKKKISKIILKHFFCSKKILASDINVNNWRTFTNYLKWLERMRLRLRDKEAKKGKETEKRKKHVNRRRKERKKRKRKG